MLLVGDTVTVPLRFFPSGEDFFKTAMCKAEKPCSKKPHKAWNGSLAILPETLNLLSRAIGQVMLCPSETVFRATRITRGPWDVDTGFL